ncbi:pyridine nucleotide-disulfide oxidoreductase-domain-containing protein [Peziza echinospora]|nr:pyridine nucleotide-disulfide oxidoreductase-domain-containing protein [Peziza echinospora]
MGDGNHVSEVPVLPSAPIYRRVAASGGTTTAVLARVVKQQHRCLTISQLDAAKGDRERVVILGSGWAGFGLSRTLDTRFYQPVVISPRNYFVFTPLLASAAVGTLEPRVTMEMVRAHSAAGPMTARAPAVELYQGWAEEIDFAKREVIVEEAFGAAGGGEGIHGTGVREEERIRHGDGEKKRGKMFRVGYDKLVVAVGCYAQTFGVKGVKEHAWFLKDVADARGIRRRVLECFEIASLPTTTPEQRDTLLHFAIVGGGPTGIEFAAELHDLVADDLPRLYPSLVPHVRITVYDVSTRILSMFDATLAKYAERTFARQNIRIKTQHHVLEVREGPVLVTAEEGEVPVGMVVWSTGISVGPFIRRLTHADGGRRILKDPRAGRICVDGHLRVQVQKEGSEEDVEILPDVFALGDCSSVAQASPDDLPATAQVANQQALYLRKTLNKAAAAHRRNPEVSHRDPIDVSPYAGFSFKNAGIMAYIGGWRAITQFSGSERVRGRLAWIMWRTAYLSMSVGWRNRILIPTYWAINWLFGRDMTRY